MGTRRDTWLPIALAAAFLVVALVGQAFGDTMMSMPESSTTAVVGRASSSYLTGVRRYAAAILWNRIDPLLHGYYRTTPLDQQRYMLSTIATVEWLDPDFAQPYYVGAWILVRNDKADEGLSMAERGTEQIPESGTLHMSYAQMLLVLNEDTKGALRQAKLAVEPDMRWTDDIEKLNGYAAISKMFEQMGEPALAKQIQPEIDRLYGLVGDQPLEDEHEN